MLRAEGLISVQIEFRLCFASCRFRNRIARMFAARRAAGILGGVAAGSLVAAAAASTADSNSAFVFIKPHANTSKAQALVSSTLKSKGIKISTEGELTGEQIDQGMLIDQHYYAIASKATLLKPKDMPVPADKFEAAFGLPWAKALEQGTVYNALGEAARAELGVGCTA